MTIGAAVVAALTVGMLAPATAVAVDESSRSASTESDRTSTMSVDGTTFQSGTTLNVDYTTDMPADDNWIGVYRADEVPGAPDVYSAVWDHAPGESGTVSLNLSGLAPGDWVVWFLAEGEYEPLAELIPISLTDGPAITENSMSFNKSEFETGEQLTVSYATIDPHSTNWVGIYPDGDAPDTNASTLWEYAPGSSGYLEFTLDLAPGLYHVWFLARDGYEPVYERMSFTITAPSGVAVPGDPEAPATSTAVETDISTDGVLVRETFDAGLPEGWRADFGTNGGEESGAASMTAADSTAFAGWTETNRDEWRSAVDEMRHRFARTQGSFLVADAQQYGAGDSGAADYSATLTSAPIEVEFLRSIRLTFDSHYRGAAGQVGSLSASFDGGEWDTLLTLDSDSVTDGYDERQMNAMQDISLAVPEGAQSVQFAWEFDAGAEARYWGIDSVTVHQGALENESASTNAWIVSDIQGHPHDLEHGLSDFNELMPDPAALMMVGDIVNTGAAWEWDEIYDVMENTAEIRPDLTIASIGNHERYAAGGFGSNLDRFLEFAGREDAYAEYVLEGPGGNLPVITIGQEFGSPSDVAMSDAQVEFLEERLAYWTAQGSQVIINTHFPLGNTVSASWMPHYSNHHQMNDRLTNILGNYPNAIVFAGHTHYPAGQGDWSVQRRTDGGHPDGFWAVNTLAMHVEWDARGEHTSEMTEVVTGDINRGLTLESFGDRVVVTAHDFASDEQLRQVMIPNPLAPFAADEVPLDERPDDGDESGTGEGGNDGTDDGANDASDDPAQQQTEASAAATDDLATTGTQSALAALITAVLLALLGGGALLATRKRGSAGEV